MRIRNEKNKEEILDGSTYLVKEIDKYKNNWQSYFKNNNPIYLEIGSGKCNFLFENAIRNPNINYIGIEKFSSILAKGLKNRENNLKNICFINIDAKNIDTIFNHEISEIFLNFSDPWPKKRHIKRRLTSKEFLSKYTFISDGLIKIIQKTDNEQLFAFSLESFSQNGFILDEVVLDLENKKDVNNILTEYEEKFINKGNKIFQVIAYKKI